MDIGYTASNLCYRSSVSCVSMADPRSLKVLASTPSHFPALGLSLGVDGSLFSMFFEYHQVQVYFYPLKVLGVRYLQTNVLQ